MVEKRNRAPMSCEPCRIRKLKCNRELPCDTCIKRGANVICQYAANANRGGMPRVKQGDLKERLKDLEDLVSSLAHREAVDRSSTSHFVSSGPSSSVEDSGDATCRCCSRSSDAKESLSHGSFHGGAARYVDSNHWSSVLDSVRDIRAELSHLPEGSHNSSSVDIEPIPEDDSYVGDLDLAVASTRTMDRQQILRDLPPRHVCDSLVSQYFRSEQIILPILHPQKFQREYHTFWNAPEKASLIWVALLFAVLSLARTLQASAPSHQSEPVILSAKVLTKRSEQSLILGDYVTNREHSMEALGVHLHSCYLQTKGSDIKLWLLLGTVLRLAISRGYHREPAQLSSSDISTFEGEMRRRTWCCLSQADTLMSFQMGLPSMIPSQFCDTEPPRNLQYSDFLPETTILPVSRPFSDYTPVAYLIVKAPVMAMFRGVVSHARSLQPPHYDKTVALDKKIRDTYDRVPLNFKYKPLGESIWEHPGIIINRVTVEILSLKSLIVLHRQHISDQQDDHYRLSQNSCMEAAIRIVDRQVELYEATRPGAQLHDQRWMVSALVTNDFILAAVVLCLHLKIMLRRSETVGRAEYSRDPENIEGFDACVDALQRAYMIWKAEVTSSSEARITAQVLASTLKKVDHAQEQDTNIRVTDDPDTSLIDGAIGRQLNVLSDASSAGEEMDLVDWSLLDDIPIQDFDLELWMSNALENSQDAEL